MPLLALALLVAGSVYAAPPKPLRGGFENPMPGGRLAGYAGDTGLDIGGSPRPIFALAAGTLEYSEPGHTVWTGPRDTANSVRFALDQPILYKGRRITHVYYTHLSKLRYLQPEAAAVADPTTRRHVTAGEELGVSGTANGSPHLHIGLLLDGHVAQDSWVDILTESQIREVLGRYKNGEVL
ncbi:MAG: hypothetical protein ABIP39_08360 [Polyangiaceae bacterium]